MRQTPVERLERFASGDTGPLELPFYPTAIRAQLTVAQVGGAAPSLTVSVQDSVDGGTTWSTLDSFTEATAEGSEVIDVAGPLTTLARVVWVIAGSVDEQQTVTLTDATGGTFTLTFDGQETAAIAYDAAASAVQSALEALSTIDAGGVAVTGSAGGPYTVTFQGTLGGQDVPEMTADGGNLTGTSPDVAVATSTPGDQVSCEFQVDWHLIR